MSHLEASLIFQLKVLKIEPPEREYRFALHHIGGGPGIRKRLQAAGLKDWRFDMAWPDRRFAVEVEGGGGSGRHTTAKGFREDMTKYHHARQLGWDVYRCDGTLIKSGKAIRLLEQLLK